MDLKLLEAKEVLLLLEMACLSSLIAGKLQQEWFLY
jgi:hypothetical protein